MNFILPDSKILFDTKQGQVDDYELYMRQLGANDQSVVVFDLSQYCFCGLTTQTDVMMNTSLKEKCLD